MIGPDDIEAMAEDDAVLTLAVRKAERGLPPDRLLTTEQYYPLIRAAVFWRNVATDLGRAINGQTQGGDQE